ncbi:MAG: amidohydrolase 2 [Sediminibacterium sp.]|nr:amidohydrolase 2 [Sediminibacterium sp.]
MRIDAHQHFWYYAETMSWITEDLHTIRKDFLPADLEPLLRKHSMDGCIAVQADHSRAETAFLLEQADAYEFIKGVVGWVDLRSEDIDQQLARYSHHPKLKGFRHVLQSEEPAFMLQPAFTKGIGALGAFGFTYDLLLFPEHLEAALTLVKKFPGQPFVVDHLAKPSIRSGEIDNWQKNIKALAACDNVYCKVSGMVTEADWQHLHYEVFVPYLAAVTEAFGTKRLLFGSDWPVCLVAAGYEEMISIPERYFAPFSAAEQAMIFGENARHFYHVS